MQTSHRSEIDLAEKIFNTATVTVGGLYLATHAVIVTLIATAAASLLTGWTMWLSHRRASRQLARRRVCRQQDQPGHALWHSSRGRKLLPP